MGYVIGLLVLIYFYMFTKSFALFPQFGFGSGRKTPIDGRKYARKMMDRLTNSLK